MATPYRTKQGDVLDSIVWRQYKSMQMLTAVLIANRGLCTQPPVLPAGLTLTLPDAAPPTARAPVQKLWD